MGPGTSKPIALAAHAVRHFHTHYSPLSRPFSPLLPFPSRSLSLSLVHCPILSLPKPIEADQFESQPTTSTKRLSCLRATDHPTPLFAALSLTLLFRSRSSITALLLPLFATSTSFSPAPPHPPPPPSFCYASYQTALNHLISGLFHPPTSPSSLANLATTSIIIIITILNFTRSISSSVPVHRRSHHTHHHHNHHLNNRCLSMFLSGLSSSTARLDPLCFNSSTVIIRCRYFHVGYFKFSSLP
jgi:hypothetical protein